MKKNSYLIAVSFFVFVLTILSGYLSMAQATEISTQEKKPVNVGNKICPVLGEKIDEKTKATYEYKGKIYNLCCTGCVEGFKKDPEKYIKKVEEELQAESKEEGSASSHGMHGGQHH